MDPLEDYLRQATALPSAGSGRFQLDPRRQTQLLGQLGLAFAEQGFLKLSQAAVRSGSPFLKVDNRGPSSVWEFSPQLPLLAPCWEPGQAAWQVCLSLALLSLSQKYNVQWAWPGGRGKVEDGHFEERVAATEMAHFQVRAKPRQRSIWSQLSGALKAVQKIRPQLNYLPLRLEWDGKPQDTQVGRLSSSLEVLIYHPQGQLRFDPNSRAPQVERIDWQPDRGGQAALGATSRSWSETLFVLDGIALEKEKNLLDRPGVLAVISAHGLNSSLSGLELVHDDAFRQRLQEVRPHVHFIDRKLRA
jgi:hypothetical protein